MMTGVSEPWLCQQIVAGCRDAVIFADLTGVIRLWNVGASEIFGYAAAEVLGRPLDLIIPANLRDRHNQGYQKVVAEGASKYSKDLLAVPALTKDGRRISLEFTLTLVRDASGRLLGIAAIIREVTARWQRDRELQKRLADLEAQIKG